MTVSDTGVDRDNCYFVDKENTPSSVSTVRIINHILCALSILGAHVMYLSLFYVVYVLSE